MVSIGRGAIDAWHWLLHYTSIVRLWQANNLESADQNHLGVRYNLDEILL
jgi:hypothetical protein